MCVQTLPFNQICRLKNCFVILQVWLLDDSAKRVTLVSTPPASPPFCLFGLPHLQSLQFRYSC